VVVLDGFDAADTGTHRNPDLMPVFFRDFQARMLDRLSACSDTVVDKRVSLANVFWRHVPGRIEAIDDAADTRWKRTCIEVLDQLNPGIAFADILPGVIQPAAYR